ncbi:MAG: DUF4097 family beta strand repeat protein [Clostridia bacterium]|nr:DUF4097 family beta strand repeat protein [Clostridia bacterium]
MNETVKRIVEILFQDTVMTEEVAAIKDEVMNNCQERYEDLRARGMTEDEAIAVVLESLKGMEEVLAEFPKVRREPEAVEATGGDRDLLFDAAQVTMLDVHFISENVTIEASDDEMIHVQYNADKLPYVRAYMKNGTLFVERDEEKVRLFQDEGNTRRNVKIEIDDSRSSLSGIFNAIGEALRNISVSISFGDGEIIIQLPEGWSNGSVRCQTTSGDVEVDSVRMAGLTVNTTSGDVTVEADEAVLGNASVKTTSGDVELSVMACDECTVQTTSGDVELSGHYDRLSVGTMSGDVNASGGFGSVSGKTVSGDFDMNACEAVPALRAVEVNSVSGDVDIDVPDSDVSANVYTKTVSGDARNDLTYHGEPAVSIRVHTVSGDITVS